jgi:hypothetical protein
MATKISITQGLAELKLLDKRIKKLASGSTQPKSRHYSDAEEAQCFRFVDVKTKTHAVDQEALKQSAEANYQSFNDLVKRHNTIKRAIIQSNATTNVSIGNWTGTVAEAIEHKASIAYKEMLVASMKKQRMQATARLEEAQDEVTKRLDTLLSSEMGKDVRTNPETINTLTTGFLENNKVSLVDPLQSHNLINALEAEVEAFKTNVDWVLAETNGKTLITV